MDKMWNATLHRTGLFASLALALLLTIFAALPTLSLNWWSLAYWRLSARNEATLISPPSAPHRRADAWLANAVVDTGQSGRIAAHIFALSHSPDRFVRRAAGQLYAMTGDFDSAIETWTVVGDYRSLHALATTLQSDGRDRVAFRALRAAHAVSPELGAAELAAFLVEHNAPEEAMRTLDDAIEAYPRSLFRRDWLRQQGRIAREQRAWMEAVAISQRLAIIDPVAAELELGRLAYARGDGVDAGLVHFRRAADIDPTRGDAFFEMAALLQTEGRYAEADSWIQAALRVEPDQRDWQRAWGDNAQYAGDLTTAIERYEAALGRFPDDPHLHAALGWTRHLAGDDEAAIGHLARALAELLQPPAQYAFHAGVVYEALGRLAEAEAAYASSLAADPGNEGARSGLARVRIRQ